MSAYYNENDPYAAEWLRNLINAGHIAPGVVDERSIEDVRPDDLREFIQCHFFAGIGIWSAALRAANWPDDRPVWTGSEPCQPFSQAGEGLGTADERYLRPCWQHLIRVCHPAIILGEQVGSALGLDWLDIISSDLEGEGYAFGAAVTTAAGSGAAHIRARLYWVAHANETRSQGWLSGRSYQGRQMVNGRAGLRGPVGRMANSAEIRSERRAAAGCEERPSTGFEYSRETFGIGSADTPDLTGRGIDWLQCIDGKWRPVESGTFPLVDGDTSRMGRLCAYGNGLDYRQSANFVMAADDATRSFLITAGD